MPEPYQPSAVVPMPLAARARWTMIVEALSPSPARWPIRERIRQANQLVQAEFADWPSAHYIDIYPHMLGADGTPRPELFADDGLHLSAEGYRVWSRVVNAARPQFT